MFRFHMPRELAERSVAAGADPARASVFQPRIGGFLSRQFSFRFFGLRSKSLRYLAFGCQFSLKANFLLFQTFSSPLSGQDVVVSVGAVNPRLFFPISVLLLLMSQHFSGNGMGSTAPALPPTLTRKLISLSLLLHRKSMLPREKITY